MFVLCVTFVRGKVTRIHNMYTCDGDDGDVLCKRGSCCARVCVCDTRLTTAGDTSFAPERKFWRVKF